MKNKNKQYAVWRKTDGRCWYCGEQLTIHVQNQRGEGTENFFHVDHVKPKVSGGNDDIRNLVPACRVCNVSKRNKSLEVWRDYLTWKNIGRFSQSQIDWLLAHEIEIPRPPKVVFYFETIGLG